MTAVSKSFGQTSFHEATLSDLVFNGSCMELAIDGAVRAGRRVPVRLSLYDVGGLLRDGQPVNAIAMEAPDGEILSFDRTDGHYVLIVEWNDFEQRRQHTVEYAIWSPTQRLTVSEEA